MSDKYKWDSPYEWLMDHIELLDPAAVRDICRYLAEHLDSDTLQDLFQDEMDKDGYFKRAK